MKNKKIKLKIIALLLTIGLVFSYTTSNANQYKVFIDVGHGGKDNGSAHNNYVEDDINLQVAKRLKEKLEKENISVEMSRESDKYISLSERANQSNQSNSDIFISIHQNASLNPNGNGIETYYIGDSNKQLAKSIQNNVIKYTNANDRGIRKGNLKVLRENQKPSVLLECGFISNKTEGYKLSTAEYQEKIVNGIVDGIKDYLKMDKNSTTQNSNPNYAVVLSESVNVMSDRGKNFEVLGTLSKGTKVEVIDTKYDWHKIKYDNGYGYVSGVYVK